jgi:two-component system phosphate regulon sensor histidine kinase PhoR
MSLSRIELNEHIAPEGVVDFGQVTQDVVDAIRPLTAERGVAVTVEAAGPLVVTGDRDQLVQVAQNLVENAVKYSAAGGAVAVELARAPSLEAARAASGREGWVALSLLSPDTAADQAFVVLRVRDQGPGMARQHLPRLSERFYRVAGQKSGGTGLGLAIVKHIVNRHRGGIAVESAEGQGTTFSVYLPAA